MIRTTPQPLRTRSHPHSVVVDRRWQRRLLRMTGAVTMTEYADRVRAEIDRQLSLA